jgi:hypothetical protein
MGDVFYHMVGYMKQITRNGLMLGTLILMFSSSLVVAENDKNLKSGLQLVENFSDKTVVIEIGNFLPTSYRLSPGQSTVVYVSSDRQTITIRSAE